MGFVGLLTKGHHLRHSQADTKGLSAGVAVTDNRRRSPIELHRGQIGQQRSTVAGSATDLRAGFTCNGRCFDIICEIRGPEVGRRCDLRPPAASGSDDSLRPRVASG